MAMGGAVLLLLVGPVLAREPENPDSTWDASDVPGAVINSEQPLSAEEEALLKETIEQPQWEKSLELEQAWKEKGYDRPVGPEEKEKRPETIFGGQYDIQEELKRVREGSY